MTDPLKVVRSEHQIGLQSRQGTTWLSPLDALDFSDEVREAAERVGADVIEAARERRKAAS